MENKFKIIIGITAVFLVLVTHYQSIKMSRLIKKVEDDFSEFYGRLEQLNHLKEIMEINQTKDAAARGSEEDLEGLLKKMKELNDRLSSREFFKKFFPREFFSEIIHEEYDVKTVESNISTLFHEVEKLQIEQEKMNILADVLLDHYQDLTQFVSEKERVLSLAEPLKSKLSVFRSTQSALDVDDTYITNYANQSDYNQGAFLYLRVGKASEKPFVWRTLVRFNEITNSIPPKAHVISASLFLKQADAAGMDANCNYERLYLYEVLKDWNEGTHPFPEKADEGECTWNEAQSGIVAWKNPGLWGSDGDVDESVVAVADGVRTWSRDKWVKFIFNSRGLKRLQKMIKEHRNYGWLIKQGDEESLKKRIHFYSGDSKDVDNAPYIKVIYTLKINN